MPRVKPLILDIPNPPRFVAKPEVKKRGKGRPKGVIPKHTRSDKGTPRPHAQMLKGEIASYVQTNRQVKNHGGGMPMKPYDHDLCVELCDMIGAGINVAEALKKFRVSQPVFRRWRLENAILREMYREALMFKAEVEDGKQDDIILMMKNGTIKADVGKAMLQVRQWRAENYFPRLYGKNVDITTGGDKISNTPLPVELIQQMVDKF